MFYLILLFVVKKILLTLKRNSFCLFEFVEIERRQLKFT